MRIAILGVGRLGASHAATLRSLPEVEELRVFDSDPRRAAEVASGLGAACSSTVDEALAGADAAVIVTPTATHASLIQRCVEAGIAAFCEKPLALSVRETREVADLVERAGGRLQVGFQRRFDAGYAAARAAVQDGSLGAVHAFVMVSCDRTPPPDAYVAGSGGQMKDQLIHDFDICRWLLDQEVEEVMATGSTLGFPSYDSFGDTGTSAVIARLSGGTVGLFTALRRNEAGYDVHAELHGALGTVAVGIDPRTPWRPVEKDAPELAGPAYPSFVVRFADAYRAELEHFVRYARGEAAERCTARDALEAIRIAEAASIALRERRPVRLAEI